MPPGPIDKAQKKKRSKHFSYSTYGFPFAATIIETINDPPPNWGIFFVSKQRVSYKDGLKAPIFEINISPKCDSNHFAERENEVKWIKRIDKKKGVLKMGKATQDLLKEHNAILHVLKILDKMMLSKREDIGKYYEEVAYFFIIFADKCHHGKEEKYLFKELVNRGVKNSGGPIGTMLQEHILGREYLTSMTKSLEAKDLKEFNDAAAKYATLLRSHIEKENDIIFAMADKLIDEAKQEVLFTEFERHEESVVGHGVHEQLHSMIDRWAAEFDQN